MLSAAACGGRAGIWLIYESDSEVKCGSSKVEDDVRRQRLCHRITLFACSQVVEGIQGIVPGDELTSGWQGPE